MLRKLGRLASPSNYSGVDLDDDPLGTFCNWRKRRYADGKPRPLMRGTLHGVGLLALFVGAVIASMKSAFPLACGLLGKAATYGASATFHLVPFATVDGVTRAFIADLICVPVTLCGAIAPFVPSEAIGREAAVAACVLLCNAGLVIWQTRGQRGLKTRDDRSDTPRGVLVGAYTLWAIFMVSLAAGIDVTWAVMVGMSLLALALSQPVTAAHEREPLSRRVPWHVPGVWSFHEDFHLAIAGADVAWLILALRYHASQQMPAAALFVS